MTTVPDSDASHLVSVWSLRLEPEKRSRLRRTGKDKHRINSLLR